MYNLQTARATALLVGTVIGAGVLGIPYVVAKAGFITGIITIILLGLIVLFLNLLFGEVILRTPGNHQMPGYAGIYLGKWGKRIMTITVFLGIYGALTAYLIGEGKALSAIFGATPTTFTLLFFVITAAAVYLGLKFITKTELIAAGTILILVLVISFLTIFSDKFNLANLTTFNPANLLIPFGVILYAFHGVTSIPEMKEYLIRDRKKMKKAIILGSIIPLIVYILFAFSVVGVTGEQTTGISTLGLGESLGQSMIVFGNIFAVFAMFTSFLTLALAMKEMYIFDYKINKHLAFLLTMFIPLAVFLLGANDFIAVIGITGAFTIGTESIMVILTFWKARKHGGRVPEYKLGKKYIIGGLLILLFLFGMINQLLGMI